MQYWDSIETASREELIDLQNTRLQEVVRAAAEQSPFYRERFKSIGVNIDSFKGLDDLRKLPFIEPADLLRNPSSIPPKDKKIVTIRCSGGTSDTPKIIFRSEQDLSTSAEIAARMFFCNGVRNTDTVLLLQPFGIWGIGSIAFDALMRIGATIVPLGVGIPEPFMMSVIKSMPPTVIYTSPRYATMLTHNLETIGLDCRSMGIRLFMLAGEGFGPSTREFLAQKWGADTFNIYGSEETDGLGAECQAHSGIHIWEDQFIFEFLNPDTLAPALPGQIAELVVTTLTKETYPLIRYRIGDLVEVFPGTCECGRTHTRIAVHGRTTDTLVLVDSTKIYGYQIARALAPWIDLIESYQVICERADNGGDALKLLVVPRDKDFNAAERNKISEALINLSVAFATVVQGGGATIDVINASASELVVTSRGKVPIFVDRRPKP
jgi:phenylacetate-CoA ligase